MERADESSRRALQLFVIVLTVALFSESLIYIREVAGFYPRLAVTAILYGLLFLVIFLFLRHGGEGLSNLGLRTSEPRKYRLKALILLAAAIGFAAQLIWLIILAPVGNLFFNFSALRGSFLLTVLVWAVLVGFVEESAFRGFIQRKLTPKYGFARALILASFLFTISHIPFYSLFRSSELGMSLWDLVQFGVAIAVTTLPLGLFLGYFYIKSNQNLLPPILLHITINTGGFILSEYSTAPWVALSSGYGLFIVLRVLWAVVAGALVWVAIKVVLKEPSSPAWATVKRIFKEPT